MTAIHDHPLLPVAAATIEIGSVLRQIMNSMEAFQLEGRSAPDAPPIAEVLHMLVLDVLEDELKDIDIAATAQLLERIGTAIGENIFMLGPDVG